MGDNREIVVIGCGAAGGTAAQFARKTDRKASITIFEKTMYPQYSKCGLPYAISGEIPKFEELIEFPREWFEKQGINIFLETRLERIDVKKHLVVGRQGGTVIEKTYDSLVIATGARPYIPPIQNVYQNGRLLYGVHVLRTIEDARQIFFEIKNDEKATIVGAGMIGLEVADCLYKKGMKVTIVEALPTVLANSLDSDMSDMVLQMIGKYVTLFMNHIITGVYGRNGKINKVFIKNKETGEEKEIDTDILVIAAGIKPEISLAKKIGCRIGETGGIIVDKRCETTIRDVYAAGDCTEYIDFVTKKPAQVGLGSIAVRQGIAAGINAAGGNYEMPDGILQTRTSRFFEIEIAAVGPTEKSLQKNLMVSGKFKGSSLPKYLPGGEPIIIKTLIHGETGRILSAQAVGSNAAQRINTFACAIYNEMKVEKLRKLETAYAPTIAPTLDAITLACDAAYIKLKHHKKSSS